MISLGLRRRCCGRGRGSRAGSNFWSPPFSRGFGFFSFASSFGLVGFNLGLDALLGFNVVLLLLAFFGSLFDLFLACELFFQILAFLGGLLANLLEGS